MPAEQQGFFRFPRYGRPIISRCVVMMFNGKLGKFLRKPFTRTQPRVGPRYSLRSVFVACQRAQFLQFGDGALGIKRHGLLAQKFTGSRFSNRPRPRSPTNSPSRTCTLPRTVTTEGRPSMGNPSNPL